MEDWLNWSPEKGFHWEGSEMTLKDYPEDGILMEYIQSIRMSIALDGYLSRANVRPIAKLMAQILS